MVAGFCMILLVETKIDDSTKEPLAIAFVTSVTITACMMLYVSSGTIRHIFPCISVLWMTWLDDAHLAQL